MLQATDRSRDGDQTTPPPPPTRRNAAAPRARRRLPEDRLMLAVLLDAVAVLREHATGVCPHAPRLGRRPPARWFAVARRGVAAVVRQRLPQRSASTPPSARAPGCGASSTDLGARALLDPPRAAGSFPALAAAGAARRSAGCAPAQPRLRAPAPDAGVRAAASPNPPVASTAPAGRRRRRRLRLRRELVDAVVRARAAARLRRRVRAPGRRRCRAAAGPRPDPATARSACRPSSAFPPRTFS